MKLLAIIIETRPIDNLYTIIKDRHIKFLPEGTDVIIYHGDKNKHQVGRVNCKKVNLFIDEISAESYNNLLTSKWFWQQFLAYERVLVFQSDSEILRTGIEKFYNTDYVGAPWKFQQHGGNGGLSLRNPQKMIDCIEKFPYGGMAKHGNEDVYFSNHLEKVGGKLATREECFKFSAESIFHLGSLGIHAIEKHLLPKECEDIRFQYNG